MTLFALGIRKYPVKVPGDLSAIIVILCPACPTRERVKRHANCPSCTVAVSKVVAIDEPSSKTSEAVRRLVPRALILYTMPLIDKLQKEPKITTWSPTTKSWDVSFRVRVFVASEIFAMWTFEVWPRKGRNNRFREFLETTVTVLALGGM